MGAEIVAIDTDSGVCFGFNEPAAYVWRALVEPRSFNQLAKSLQDEFDVDESECRADLLELLEEMKGKRLVEQISIEGE